MIVRELLKIQANIEDRKVPYDMNDADLNQHYSESKGEFQNILDMDLIHLIRSYSKCLDMGKISNENLIEQQLSNIERSIRTIKEQFYNGLCIYPMLIG